MDTPKDEARDFMENASADVFRDDSSQTVTASVAVDGRLLLELRLLFVKVRAGGRVVDRFEGT